MTTYLPPSLSKGHRLRVTQAQTPVTRAPAAHHSIITAAVLALALLLSACEVGPDYTPDAPPQSTRYTPDIQPSTFTATSSTPLSRQEGPQTLMSGRDIPGDWWTLFHSPALDALIRRALLANPTLEAAQAALRQARENVYAQQGAFFPAIAANLSPSRNKTATGNLSPNSASGNPYYSIVTAQLTVSYVPDVFGANRRAVESLQAQAQSQRWQLEATYLTLTSNVVAAAIQEAGLRAQIDATNRVIGFATEGLRVLNKQKDLGQVSGAEVFSQAALLAQAQATLPPLEKQLAQNRNQLAALTGRLPDQLVPETFHLADLQLPAELPLSIPSEVINQRPDILQATETARAASAQIGVAVANRIPAIALTANLGSSPGSFANLFTPGNGFFSIAAAITQPIFQGGQLLHRQRATEAAFDQAQNQYRSTVLTAFQNVADALQALRTDADAVRAARYAAETAGAGLQIVRTQLRLGQVAYLALLISEQLELQAQLTLAQAQSNRLADTAALMQALGGGWWNRTDVRVDDVNGKSLLGILGLRRP